MKRGMAVFFHIPAAVKGLPDVLAEQTEKITKVMAEQLNFCVL